MAAGDAGQPRRQGELWRSTQRLKMSSFVDSEQCVPFLKWAGGKRWLAKANLLIFPTSFNGYIEPFLGSGAVFFALSPSRAVLSDINSELIATYTAVRDNWRGVASLLGKYQRHHSKTFYYRMRDSEPTSPSARAARFIYLNRACWNGLYRVNLHGKFNVPKGTKERIILDADDFQRVSLALRRATLLVSEFKPVIDQAGSGDMVFADPPYVTSHPNNGFLKYNEKLFSWEDQVSLRDCLLEAKERGAHVVATNADTHLIRRLYEGNFKVRSVTRSSIIASGKDKRGPVKELVITSF